MVDNPKVDFYEVLGITRTASQEEIKAAYRKLGKLYHPDINPSADAKQRMTLVNAAYEILGNTTKRAAYDISKGLPKSYKEESTTNDPLKYARAFESQVRCQRCGRFDHTLRLTVFPYVLSFLLFSMRRAQAGIYCDHCRSIKSTIMAVISLLFGPWGFPWGIIWTVQAVYKNARKGDAPIAENIELLKQLAWVSAIQGRVDEAKAALDSLLKLDLDIDTITFQRDLESRFPHVAPSPNSRPRLAFASIILSIFVLYSFLGYQFFKPSNESFETSSLGESSESAGTSISSILNIEDLYVQQCDSWLSQLIETEKTFDDATSSIVTYTQAVNSSNKFINACHTYSLSLEELLTKVKAYPIVPANYSNLNSYLAEYLDSYLKYVNMLEDAIQNRSSSLWNQAVNLQFQLEDIRQELVNEIDKITS